MEGVRRPSGGSLASAAGSELALDRGESALRRGMSSASATSSNISPNGGKSELHICRHSFQSGSSGHLAQSGRCCPTGSGLSSARQSVTASSMRSRTFKCAFMPASCSWVGGCLLEAVQRILNYPSIPQNVIRGISFLNDSFLLSCRSRDDVMLLVTSTCSVSKEPYG